MLSELLRAVFESPLQIILLLVLYAKGKLTIPWESVTTIDDGYGNLLNLGPLPGIFSMIMSVLSVVKGCIAISEAKGVKETIFTIVFGVCTILFRTLSYTAIIIYFNKFSILMLITIIVATVIVIYRMDKNQKAEVSLLSTVLISLFVPIAFPKQPEKKQLKEYQNEKRENIVFRNRMTRRISLVTLPIILCFDTLLFLLLKYHTSFKTADDIILSKESSALVLAIFVLPLGIASLCASFSMRLGGLKKKHYFGILVTTLVFLISTTTLITFSKFGKYFYALS